MSKTALIITHATEICDKSKSVQWPIENFIHQNPEIDIIRLKDPNNDDYIKGGEVIESKFGSLDEKTAKRIVSAYDKIVTAGGFFNFCALRTYNCLLSAYFNDNQKPLEIVVPLNMLYTPETDLRRGGVYPRESYTIEDVINASVGTYKGSLKWHLRHRFLKLNHFAQNARVNYNNKFSYYMPNKELIVKNEGLRLVALKSHQQIS